MNILTQILTYFGLPPPQQKKKKGSGQHIKNWFNFTV